MGSCLPRSQNRATDAETSEKSESENFSNSKLSPLRFQSSFSEALQKQTMSILLVFSRDDKQCIAFQQAARLAKYKCSVVRSMDSILSGCMEHSPNVVIVDARQPSKIEVLCKTFSMLHNREAVVLVAVRESVSSSSSNKSQDVLMQPLIKVGFTRQFLENFSLSVCLTELQCIEHGELQNRFQFQMAHSFLAAVDSCSDSIEISNAKNEIMYVNSSFERLFGYTKKEVIGKTFLTLTNCNHGTDLNIIEAMKSQMRQGISWKGMISVCKKGGELFSHRCFVIPILGQSGHVQSFVVVRNEMGGNFAFARRGSLDLPSPGKSREAGVRMGMTIEAPMTKVIHMIGLIQASCPSNVAESLDNVLEVLRSSELYVPIKGDNVDNQMTTELLEGLMTAPTMRRLSISTTYESPPKLLSPASFCPTLPVVTCNQLSWKVQSVLSKESHWDFNIMDLERVTEKKPLQYLCMKTFERFGVAEFLKIDQGTLYLWFRVIESHYHASNTYHNSTHAADVMHAASYFLNLDVIKNLLELDERVSVLIAAVVHDLDHPGKTNTYLINSNSYMAQLYNDLTVLESHHVSYAFRLTHQDVSIDIFKNLDRDEYRAIRQQIIDMVLATEMAKHMEHLSRFMHAIIDQPTSEAFTRRVSVNPSGGLDNNTIIKRMLIKCADVSNSARPRPLSTIWAERISEEYFQQTEDEKTLGLPVVMPLFDRRSCNIPKSQLSFMSLFIIDMFDVWHKFCDIPDLLEIIQSNYNYWKEQESKGITTSTAVIKHEVPTATETAV